MQNMHLKFDFFFSILNYDITDLLCLRTGSKDRINVLFHKWFGVRYSLLHLIIFLTDIVAVGVLQWSEHTWSTCLYCLYLAQLALFSVRVSVQSLVTLITPVCILSPSRHSGPQPKLALILFAKWAGTWNLILLLW